MGARLAKVAPPALRYGAAAAGGSLWWTLDVRRRRPVLANYAAVLGLPERDPKVARVAREAFRNYGRMLADFLLLGALERAELSAHLSIDGQEHADRALAGGRGAILTLPHMGSWDFAGGLASILGYRIAAVAEPFFGSLDEVVVATRSLHGLRVLPLGRAALRGIERALDENSLVALLCDLPPATGGVEVRLFGRRALVPAGPAAIACRRGVVLLPAYCRRVGPGLYHVHVDPPIPPPVEGRAGREVQATLMQQVVERFEAFIRQHPEQWYAFKRVVY